MNKPKIIVNLVMNRFNKNLNKNKIMSSYSVSSYSLDAGKNKRTSTVPNHIKAYQGKMK